ncbi:S41 family peptidase [Candidatus Gracilibacteria bacterium]|nr:S41 family peptidase [Candidatus Gracilibacteria bacterium]NUJ99473.1 S41 family peptidase [Candidatus Gracilibacteria bacterium]
MIKKVLIFISLCVYSFGYFPSYALEDNLASNTFDTTEITISQNKETENLTRQDFFEYIAQSFDKNILPSYKYIKLHFLDVKENSSLYDTLQKLVYLDIIPNKEGKIYADKNISAYSFYEYAKKIFHINISNFEEDTTNDLKKRYANKIDLEKLQEIIDNKIKKEETFGDLDTNTKEKEIFLDVYNTLKENHFDKETLDEKEMIYQAIEGLTKGTGDKFTNFFPPMENQSFQDSLSGKYQGIGAYVDMESPGILKIISPIPGSPAEKAGLKGGDIIAKVGEKEVTEKNSLYEVISWIKGPAGTKVMLGVKREEQEIFNVEVERSEIIIKEVEAKKYNDTTYYIQIKQFGDNVFEEFKMILNEIKEDKKITKIIFDLRNNPGGYLDEVNDMLSLFIQKGDAVSVVKYTTLSLMNKSKGYEEGLDLSKYKIIILQNSGTASASEIMVGTLKDYFENISIIGETSYGKGSVQTIKAYSDGSSLKFTVAKWFTGRTQIGIDGVGIKPDIELKLDEEKYKKGIDNQLEKALEIK